MIVGLTGAIASGKDSVVEIIRSYYGYKHLSFGREVRNEAKARGIVDVRQNLQGLGYELTRQFGEAYWAERIVGQMISGENYVVDGFRYLGQIGLFKMSSNFTLCGVNASVEKRYLRYNSREIESGRLKVPLTLEEFMLIDSNDKNGAQSSEACYSLIDKEIINEGTKEDLRCRVIGLMNGLRKRRTLAGNGV